MAVRYTRRHYEQFAAIIRDMRNAADADGVFTLCYVLDFADKLAVTFSRDNPRFNRERFLAACGINNSQRER